VSDIDGVAVSDIDGVGGGDSMSWLVVLLIVLLVLALFGGVGYYRRRLAGRR
jgi:hypothetical protein